MTHTICGTEVKGTYAVKTVQCESCKTKAPAGEWSVKERGGESLEHVRKVDKYAYEQEERDKLREAINKEKKERAERPPGIIEDERFSKDDAQTSQEGSSSGFEQDSQARVEEPFTSGGGTKSGDSPKDAGANILVQVLYNTHDLIAEQYGKAYSLRTLDKKTDQEFKKTLVEVSEEIGLNVALTPLQRFGFMYGSILLAMRQEAKKTAGYDVHDVEPEEEKPEEMKDSLSDDDKRVWQ